jgi:F-type H+-transporting ATPase subunit delta
MGSRVSRRYAKALLSIGQEDGNYEQYGDDLQEFAEFCAANEEFLGVMANRIFPIADRRKVLDAVLEKSSFSGLLKDFLRLLLEKERIGAVGDVAEYFQKFTDDLSNITRARIITAKPLKQEAHDNLIAVLEKLTSKKVKTVVSTDETLIGGLVVKIGDTLLDGSVKAQLKGLKESLKRGEYS